MQIDHGFRHSTGLLRQDCSNGCITRSRKAGAAYDPPPKADTAARVDSISAEDALMNARLKNICRGC
jgi:hypothetical protein